jgi:hypothetical protein
MTPRLLIFALLAAGVAAGASGCGRQGDLERPAPLFGAKAKAQYERNKAAKAAGEDLDKYGNARSPQDSADGNAKPNASGEDNSGDATDVVAPPAYDPTSTPLPQRTAPITGSSPDPFGGQPQGALPNPYANPDRSQ